MRSLVVEIGASGLKQTADKEDFKELFVVSQEFEGGAGLDELVDEGVDGRW